MHVQGANAAIVQMLEDKGLQDLQFQFGTPATILCAFLSGAVADESIREKVVVPILKQLKCLSGKMKLFLRAISGSLEDLRDLGVKNLHLSPADKQTVKSLFALILDPKSEVPGHNGIYKNTLHLQIVGMKPDIEENEYEDKLEYTETQLGLNKTLGHLAHLLTMHAIGDVTNASVPNTCHRAMELVKDLCTLRMGHPSFKIDEWQWPENKRKIGFFTTNATMRELSPQMSHFDQTLHGAAIALETALSAIDAFSTIQSGDVVSTMARNKLVISLLEKSDFVHFIMQEEHILRWKVYSEITRTERQGGKQDPYALDATTPKDEMEERLYGRFVEFTKLRDQAMNLTENGKHVYPKASRINSLFPFRFTKSRAHALKQANADISLANKQRTRGIPVSIPDAVLQEAEILEKERLSMGVDLIDLEWPYIPGNSLDPAQGPHMWQACVAQVTQDDKGVLRAVSEDAEQRRWVRTARTDNIPTFEIDEVDINGNLVVNLYVSTSKPCFAKEKSEDHKCRQELQFGHQRSSPQFRDLVKHWLQLALGKMTEVFQNPQQVDTEHTTETIAFDDPLFIPASEKDAIMKEATNARSLYQDATQDRVEWLLGVTGLKRAGGRYEDKALAAKAAGISMAMALSCSDIAKSRDAASMDEVLNYIKNIQIQVKDGTLFESDCLGAAIETPSQMEFSALKDIHANQFRATKELLTTNEDNVAKKEILRRMNSTAGPAGHVPTFLYRQKLVISTFSSMIAPVLNVAEVDTRKGPKDEEVLPQSDPRKAMYEKMFLVIAGQVEKDHEKLPCQIVTSTKQETGGAFLESMLAMEANSEAGEGEGEDSFIVDDFWTVTAQRLLNGIEDDNAVRLSEAMAQMLGLLDSILNRNNLQALDHLLPKKDAPKGSAPRLLMDYINIDRESEESMYIPRTLTEEELLFADEEDDEELAEKKETKQLLDVMLLDTIELIKIVTNAFDPNDRRDQNKVLGDKVKGDDDTVENIGIRCYVHHVCGEAAVPIVEVISSFLMGKVSKRTVSSLVSILSEGHGEEKPLVRPADGDKVKAYILGVFAMFADNVDLRNFRHCALALGNYDDDVIETIRKFAQGGDMNEGEKGTTVQAGDGFLAKLFAEFDSDSSGFLTFEEFQDMLRFINVNISQEKAVAIFSSVDSDGSQTLTYDEFEKGFAIIATEVAHAALQSLGLNDAQIYAAIATGLCLLMGIIAFIFMGMAAFTENSTFGSVVNSSFVGGAGGATAANDEETADATDPKIAEYMEEVVNEALEQLNPE